MLDLFNLILRLLGGDPIVDPVSPQGAVVIETGWHPMCHGLALGKGRGRGYMYARQTTVGE